MAEEYTPGYTRTASNFMAQRTAASHAAFLVPHLRDSARLLDCGCGPGSISCDFARILSAGHVTGIDREESQIELARSRASEQQLTNMTFKVGSIYELPFPDSSFDVVFAHAIFEHISSPDKALAEILRVFRLRSTVTPISKLPTGVIFMLVENSPNCSAMLASIC
jgi:ubiquinone/menaquinone biosynthesis C-methylase UbiE